MRKKLSIYLVPGLVLLGLILGTVFHFLDYESIDDRVWSITLVLGSIPLIIRIAKEALAGRAGIDIIAFVAITASFVLNQYLAGTIILLMLSGGESLEEYALRRAKKELTRLLTNAPSVAHLKIGDRLRDIKANEVRQNDVFIIKPGEVVPADGLVLKGKSDVDESAITGEPLPVLKNIHSKIFSGSTNQDGVLEVRALKDSLNSTYENIIKLVKEAENSRAPLMRLADRYSLAFTLVTFALAALAWYLSHDAIRLLAVLVVATPCPLILATPIAIMSGISRAASKGIIVKSGGSLEALGEARAFIFDKTGTLTLGAPQVAGIKIFTPASPSKGAAAPESEELDEVLRLAASLDQLSGHVLAKSLADYAAQKKIELMYPENFKESFGEGVMGELEGKNYSFGKLAFLENQGVAITQKAKAQHLATKDQSLIAVYLAQDRRLLGAVIFEDKIRPESKNLFSGMAQMGMDKIIMLTGDSQKTAEKIAAEIGITDIHAECLPDDKVREIKDHQKQFGKVAMVGDGVNDAPALASADVGLAIGGHSATATSDTSDIVIVGSQLYKVGLAFKIAKRTLQIAKQSIFLGMGISIVLMVMAALGHIQPIYGALLQEVLDVAVIFNALRVNFVKMD